MTKVSKLSSRFTVKPILAGHIQLLPTKRLPGCQGRGEHHRCVQGNPTVSLVRTLTSCHKHGFFMDSSCGYFVLLMVTNFVVFFTVVCFYGFFGSFCICAWRAAFKSTIGTSLAPASRRDADDAGLGCCTCWQT